MDLAAYRGSAEAFVSELTNAYYRHYAGLEDEYAIEPIFERHAELFDRAAVDDLRELSVVRKVLETAAAALAEMRAHRVDAGRPRGQHFGRERLRVTPLDLPNAGTNTVTGQAAPNEDHKAAVARHTVAPERERLDVELELVAPSRTLGCGLRFHRH